jgi:hypothetical protein
MTMIVIIPFKIVYQPSYFPSRRISKRKNSNFVFQLNAEEFTAVKV